MRYFSKDVESKINYTGNRAGSMDHMIRPRINKLLTDAAKNSVITICAGAGCGKTCAVSDFIRQQERPFVWMQINERDNSPSRFWENFINTVMNYDASLVDEYREIGFPDTQDKMDRFQKLRKSTLMSKPGMIVFDDFHLLKEASVLRFMEKMINEIPPTSMMILICRDLPKININTLQMKGCISDIRETDLSFSESELTEYLRKQGLTSESHIIREIYKDTQGWAFAINLVARSLKRIPNYFGYVKTTLKKNIFELMETEAWDAVPDSLRHFLVRLSLVDHLSLELVDILAAGRGELLHGLRNQSAYVHYDNYGGAYQIHHLFLDFLCTKQDILTDEERYETYKAAADWCVQNNFKIDALGYFEKIGDYQSIVSVFFTLPPVFPYDIAQYAKGIFDRAPAEAFERVMFLATMHMTAVASTGNIQEYFALTEFYERKFLALPEDDPMRNNTLSGIYYSLGIMRAANITDENYDFDAYFAKMFSFQTKESFKLMPAADVPLGPWINLTYSAQKGSLQKYIEAMIRLEKLAAPYYDGMTSGKDDLIQGELLFYQGDVQAAEPFIISAMENAKKREAYQTLHRALFYMMRIAVAKGNLKKAEAALSEIEGLLGIKNFYQCFVGYDIAFGWFQYILRQPEVFPEWLKGNFSPYSHASTVENFGNQIKARYCYFTRDYRSLLFYIGELKQRESFLYGRIEMLAMEACVYFHMKDKNKALYTLWEAYEEASPNDILMPFIQLGKDMRTLTMAALREPDFVIPRSWLEIVRRKSSSYSKYQSLLIAENKNATGKDDGKGLSPREKDILNDLYQGLSRSEIADNRRLAIGTVNTIANNIYKKLNAQSIADIIRIVSEQKHQR